MSARAAALLLCILCTGTARAAVSDYAYAWPLYTDGDSAAWQVELTPEVYAAISTEDLRDVEVVNAAGAPVPIAPYRAPAGAVEQEHNTDLPLFVLPATAAEAGADAIQLHIERGADGKLRRLDADVGAAPQPGSADAGDVLLDASSLHAALTMLRIDWNGDASAQFAVSASDDLQHWRAVINDAAVLRITQGGNVLERHEIALGNTRALYLRLHRQDRGAALRELHTGVRSVSYTNVALPERQWLAATLDGSETKLLDHGVPAGDGTRPIAYRYHLPAALRASGLKVELADDNSVVSGTVLSSSGSAGNTPLWSVRSTFVAFRLRQGDAIAGNDEFAVAAGARAHDWRIELSTPLDHAPALAIAYRPDRFVFLAEGAGPYRLVAGSARARHGDYPVDAALTSLRTKLGNDWQPPLTRLGARELSAGEPALVNAPPAPAQDRWKQWLLWAVLVAAAAVVGGLALSLLRKPNA
jgi:hypothetical protein